MSARVYYVPGQTEGRKKAVLEWTSIDSSSKLPLTRGGIGHEITLKNLKFILNLIEKVKPGFLLFSMCLLPESNGTKFQSHSFHLENPGILHARMDQRGDPIKMNFNNFQMQK